MTAIFQMKKRDWQHTKRSELLQKFTKAQLLLAPSCLCWAGCLKRQSLHYHETDTMWGKWIKWITLITQQAGAGNPNHPGVSEVIMEWPEDKDLGILPDEEVMHAEESPL